MLGRTFADALGSDSTGSFLGRGDSTLDRGRTQSASDLHSDLGGRVLRASSSWSPKLLRSRVRGATRRDSVDRGEVQGNRLKGFIGFGLPASHSNQPSPWRPVYDCVESHFMVIDSP